MFIKSRQMGQIFHRLGGKVKAQLPECTIQVSLHFRWKIRDGRSLSSVHQVVADGTNHLQVGKNVKAQLLECTILVLLRFRWKIRARRGLSTEHRAEQSSYGSRRWDKSSTGWKCEM